MMKMKMAMMMQKVLLFSLRMETQDFSDLVRTMMLVTV